MDSTHDNTVRRNATRELTREEAQKKRKALLELAKREAQWRNDNPHSENVEDCTLATFILPGD
ncbi:MAG: hypothetical protein HRT77_08325 [Halioglobus sp.]|nr:hypothetical protein [Halioglobus sp.]